MNPLLSTLVECESWNQHEGFEALASEVIARAVTATQIKLAKGAEVSLLLCDDARIAKINCEWRGLDKPTNVLSVPAAPRGESKDPQPDSRCPSAAMMKGSVPVEEAADRI